MHNPTLLLELLLFYYTLRGRTEDFPAIVDSTVASEDLEYLTKENMIVAIPKNLSNEIRPYYRITERGRFYVDYLLDVPLPVEKVVFEIERPIEALKEVLS